MTFEARQGIKDAAARLYLVVEGRGINKTVWMTKSTLSSSISREPAITKSEIVKLMTIETHQRNESQIAEVISTDIVIKTAEDGLDLLGNLYYQGFDRVILHQTNITPGFFDLRTGMAGEILQKFSNYRVRLAIVGDFTPYASRSLNDFIFESNKAGHINFVGSLAEALDTLSSN